MIKPQKVSVIVLTVRDIERSLAWYREKFGFETLHDDAPNSDGIVVGASGVELVLKQSENPDTARPVDRSKQICCQVFGFEVDEADLDRVEQEFPEDTSIVRLDDHPRYRCRIIEDPDGHPIVLMVYKQAQTEDGAV
jgi:catechol 2,3-dioxygenase-like lactoylglutathione lyase family enzyme